jgi:hypothetical protein
MSISGLTTANKGATFLIRSSTRTMFLTIEKRNDGTIGSINAFGLNKISNAGSNLQIYHSRGENNIYFKSPQSAFSVQQIAGEKVTFTITETDEATATYRGTTPMNDILNKPDRIASPVHYNLLAMDLNGNFIDSGKKASDLTPVSATGTVEAESTASQAYAIGEHFLRNGKFCTAIADIASGAALTLNTNYVEGTIADVLANKYNYSTYNYSTTEHVVGKWIDGSTVYEKTIDFGAMPDKTTKSVDAGLPSGAKVINVFGFTADSSWGSVFPLPFADATTGSNFNFQVWYSNGHVSVKVTTGQSHMVNSYITLQYVKSSS